MREDTDVAILISAQGLTCTVRCSGSVQTISRRNFTVTLLHMSIKRSISNMEKQASIPYHHIKVHRGVQVSELNDMGLTEVTLLFSRRPAVTDGD